MVDLPGTLRERVFCFEALLNDRTQTGLRILGCRAPHATDADLSQKCAVFRRMMACHQKTGPESTQRRCVPPSHIFRNLQSLVTFLRLAVLLCYPNLNKLP